MGGAVGEWRGRLGGRRGKEGGKGGTNIFIASNCSFFGITSSIYGVNNGYVVHSCARSPLWIEDLTLDFEPGEMLRNS